MFGNKYANVKRAATVAVATAFVIVVAATAAAGVIVTFVLFQSIRSSSQNDAKFRRLFSRVNEIFFPPIISNSFHTIILKEKC